jgi:hypothetical protein
MDHAQRDLERGEAQARAMIAARQKYLVTFLLVEAERVLKWCGFPFFRFSDTKET